MIVRSILLALCAAGVAGAQTTVRVTASDYAFDAPDTVAAGLVSFELVNNGHELHHVQVVRLDSGKTMADFGAAMRAGGPPPGWLAFLGGPNAVVPDGHSISVDAVRLAPGSYVLMCFIPSPDGKLHVAKGMLRPLFVSAAPAVSQASAPRADVTLTMFDYNFELDRPLTAGHRTVRVVNKGPQPHEVLFVKLPPGASLTALPEWIGGGMKGPPPAIPAGGVTMVDANGENFVTLDLQPGEYGLYCFAPDTKDGQEHVKHGMLKSITVK